VNIITTNTAEAIHREAIHSRGDTQIILLAEAIRLYKDAFVTVDSLYIYYHEIIINMLMPVNRMALNI
jgi:uncharacterized membrane protein YesL